MTTYKQESKPVYEAPKQEKPKAPMEEYVYKEYQPVQEYTTQDYWTPAYEDIEKKYSGEKYAQKQYIPEKTTEGYGKETADYLVANKGNNVIETYAENDVVEAGYGNDKIDAGAGDDWIWGITKTHNAKDEKYAQEEYMEVDWMTSGEGKDIYALGTHEYAHYATNGVKDYAVITDYSTKDDAVMLHGAAENYVVGESITVEEDPAMSTKAATIYWDKDENGAYSEGDDMVAIFEGYSAEEITAAKDSWVYVAPEPLVA